MSGSETGVMTSREAYSVGMQQKSPVASQPVIQNMRLAFSADGKAVYKPITAISPKYQPASSGGGAEGSAGGPPVTQGQALTMSMGMGSEPLKRNRGRPRKYGPDGTMPLALIPATSSVTVTQSNNGGGFPSPPPPSGGSACSPTSTKKARGRPPGSGKKHQLEAPGSAGVGFTPHVITVKAGEDVSSKIMSFSQHGPRAVCILSANGAISNVTLRQPATSGGTLAYEGRFEILSLSGSFLLPENGGQRSRTGGLSVSLSGPDGRVLGGGVAGLLTAASPVQVVVGSFIADGRKERKSAYRMESLSAPPKLATGGVPTVATSPPSRGTLSESSGGPDSPLNQSTGMCINNNPQGMSDLPWNYLFCWPSQLVEYLSVSLSIKVLPARALVLKEVKLGSMNFQWKYNHPKTLNRMPSSDRLFLLNFIMSTYLGPDVYSDNPRHSASQRLAEGLPPYTSKNLGASFISISQLESLYYYVLRYAHPRLVLEPNVLHSYLEGNLPLPSSELLEDCMQFTSFFPLNIHEHKRYSINNEIVKGIVLIDDPVTSHMKEDVERFKSLSGLADLKIDKIKSLSYELGYQKSKEDEQNSMKNSEERISGSIANGNGNASSKFQENNTRMHQLNSMPMSVVPPVTSMLRHVSEGAFKRSCKRDGPAMMPLITVPNMDQYFSDSSIILNGTAKKGIIGPPIGVLDIGVSKVAYFFRVALPGVRKDYCEFSCEIQSNGKVHLQGSTSGGGTIKKRSRVFHMTFQQLCPGGLFTLSFSLPGPVDPRLFSPNFRSDGIFEAVVIKHES
ncbi:hypothetical protein CRYUN_Cryun28dG0119200 [Craigia yunnanensis]